MSLLKSRDDCIRADHEDELKEFREKFILPDNLIYLNGNSLGVCPHGMSAVVDDLINNEWAQKLNIAYEVNRWHKGNLQLNSNISKLVGVDADEINVEGNATLNIFKSLGTSIAIQKIENPDRRVIVLEAGNFSTDNHVPQGLVRLLSSDGYNIRYFNAETPIEEAIKEDVVVVLLSHVNWRTGELMDMQKITEMAHKVNAHIIWDLSHSVGALPINLKKFKVDFAVGCTYKYLNGGVGAPAFIFVDKKHQNRVWPPLVGWRGHQQSFAFIDEYIPGEGMKCYWDGGSSVVQLAMAKFSTDIFMDVDINAIRKKSLQLIDLFIDLMDKKCSKFLLVTPRDHDKRGSHVSYRCERGLEIRDYLREKNVHLDFRNPDILRIALTPLYTKYVDVWDAVEAISDAAKKF